MTPDNWSEPDFANAGRVHDWRNYVSEEICAMWPSMPDQLKQALARQAEATASNEEWE